MRHEASGHSIKKRGTNVACFFCDESAAEHRRGIARGPWLTVLFACSLMLLGAGGCSVEHDPGNPTERDMDQTDFLSAGSSSEDTSLAGTDDAERAPADPASDEDFGEGGEERTVEEGDIYRVLAGDMILNLNSFRGLQVIDFSNLEEPEIIGRARVTGTPVELYVHGDHAFVLMNNWRGYRGSKYSSEIEQVAGGLILSVDISDPSAPVIREHVRVPGRIETSRLVHGGGQAALYVAAAEWSYDVDEDGVYREHLETFVRSFEVTGGSMKQRSEIDLGGFVSDIQATSTALLVARNESWWRRDPEQASRVAVIDISSPDGTMVEGGEVEVAGFVFTQFNMDLYNDVLRVVSGSRWGSSPANYIETFDASDFSNLEPIDKEEFGAGEDLYATLFLGNKAFFVTYWQVDPFHAFEITDEGIATEMSEFIVSGWNDYFRAVFGESRLIGIGKNDEQGTQQAVSLYDITDLTNPEPLIERAEVDMHWSWSEAEWDHRAFSVLEGAVDVQAADGTRETGLVLLPFSGWDYDSETGHGRHLAAVQIFTFSETTLTRRGVMEHPTRVRRSFPASDEAVANLSETDIAFFDHRDPDDPLSLGSVELAPNYADYFVFGDYGARRKDEGNHYWYYRADDDAVTLIEIVDVAEDPDLAEPNAFFEVERGAQLHQVGDLLVAVSEVYDAVDMHEPGGTRHYEYEVSRSLTVHDLSNPLEPEKVGEIELEETSSGGRYWGRQEAHVVGEGLVLVQRDYNYEVLDPEEVCYFDSFGSCVSSPRDGGPSDGDREPDEEATTECEMWTADVFCERNSSGELECTGTVEICTWSDGEERECETVDVNDIEDLEQYVYCYEQGRHRSWTELSLRPIDLSNPADPVVRPAIELGEGDDYVSVLADGDDLYLSFGRPEEVEGDNRGFVRFFFKRIGFGSYVEPEFGPEVNVPGVLIAVDDSFVYTRDRVFSGNRVETAIARCEVDGDLAYLRGLRQFEKRYVAETVLDGAGHLLVTHGPAYRDGIFGGHDSMEDRMHTLSVLDAASSEFDLLSEVEVDTWASLREARPGRALFQVPGGLLIMNLDNPGSPFPQAYFPTMGWPRSIRVHDGTIVLAAGRYGIYSFPLDGFNLLPM